jgi:glyoxylase-like metal-dependent hydrolase (beta-lactamase superfamily II)
MALYSMWVLDYAAIHKFPESSLLYGPGHPGTRYLPFGYILLKGMGEVILIDTGYNHAEHGAVLADLFGVSDWHSPTEVLAECGVSPADVTTVFVTHCHFDHMGGLALFPNARFYIQRRELDAWVSALALGREFRFIYASIDPADVLRAVNLVRDGRMVCIDGDRENVLSGIDLHLAADSHTYGSMYVTVRNDGAAVSQDSWVFAGDLVYSYENLTGPDPKDPMFVPIGNAVGSQEKLIFTAAEMLGSVGGEVRRVVPVHEAKMREVFPTRRTASGLHVIEIALADGETSRVA